ncbi:hypothetical protein BTN49_0121 [Candidatus Enterovibrio escicola]|uniref:Uncharacterized protein n=1 Tax=Candidatus Enterovibrio escicola TaxID=1927127 RepID=A0A2A5T7K0_9GAMM|nr:hypothetical protein BTN49_0121 [Candidatus Enterovibrio escacola]
MLFYPRLESSATGWATIALVDTNADTLLFNRFVCGQKRHLTSTVAMMIIM